MHELNLLLQSSKQMMTIVIVKKINKNRLLQKKQWLKEIEIFKMCIAMKPFSSFLKKI